MSVETGDEPHNTHPTYPSRLLGRLGVGHPVDRSWVPPGGQELQYKPHPNHLL